MNEEAVRELVRQAVARRFGQSAEPAVHIPLALVEHASHYRYRLPASGGPCLIEPAVQCTHCGYCESHGH